MLVGAGCSDSQHPIRTQIRLHVVDVVSLGEHVPPHELPLDEPVLIWTLLVFTLHGDGVVTRRSHRYLMGRELLDVHVHLELVFVEGDFRVAVADQRIEIPP